MHSLPPLAAASKLTGPDGYLAIWRAALPRSHAGLDVITGGVLGRAAVDLPGDVVQVVALAQRRHDRHYALRLHGLQWAGSSAIRDTARRTCANCSRVMSMLRVPVLTERTKDALVLFL